MTTALIILFLLAVMAAVVYIFAVMPRVTDPADMELQSVDHAHRGLWGKGVPENSLAAFEAAVSRGYGIELDIRLSKDGQVMVFHDESLRRMCGVGGSVASYTARELKALRLSDTEWRIPELSEVFDIVRGRVPLLIEIKDRQNAPALCRAASELLDSYNGAFSVQSFDPRVLSWFKQYRPRFARGLLLTSYREYRKELDGKKGALLSFALSHMLTNLVARPDFISLRGDRRNSLGVLLALHLFKVRCFMWTVRTPDTYRLARSKNMHAIFEVIRPPRNIKRTYKR